MSGFLGDLSNVQESALHLLKQRMELLEDARIKQYAYSFMTEPLYLRFLRARKFDVEQAYQMVVNMLKFRLEFQGIGVDAIRPSMCANEIASGKAFVHAYDKDGRPIVVIRGRFHDSSKVDLLENQRFTLYLMEVCRKILRPPIETVSLVMDMSDVGRKNLDLKFMKYIIDTLQFYYPESLGRVYIYNASWFAQQFWKLVRPLLDPNTASKVMFVDSKMLAAGIGEMNLLAEYGGKDPYVYNAPAYVQSLERVMCPVPLPLPACS